MLLTPTKSEKRKIDPIVQRFLDDMDGPRLIPTFNEGVFKLISDSRELKKAVHSVRSRLKEPSHLYDKLLRKLREAKKKKKNFSITPNNLFRKITDLGGIRIIHVHTKQIAEINRLLCTIIEQQELKLIEGPIARTWDDESRAYFKSIGIKTKKSDTMYTSVHYILSSNRKTPATCEVQVRTLMEEVWGEVDHKINYPHPTDSISCREQIRALARATSTATRLVDSIFATVEEIEHQKTKGNSFGSKRLAETVAVRKATRKRKGARVIRKKS